MIMKCHQFVQFQIMSLVLYIIHRILYICIKCNDGYYPISLCFSHTQFSCKYRMFFIGTQVIQLEYHLPE